MSNKYLMIYDNVQFNRISLQNGHYVCIIIDEDAEFDSKVSFLLTLQSINYEYL